MPEPSQRWYCLGGRGALGRDRVGGKGENDIKGSALGTLLELSVRPPSGCVERAGRWVQHAESSEVNLDVISTWVTLRARGQGEISGTIWRPKE